MNASQRRTARRNVSRFLSAACIMPGSLVERPSTKGNTSATVIGADPKGRRGVVVKRKDNRRVVWLLSEIIGGAGGLFIGHKAARFAA